MFGAMAAIVGSISAAQSAYEAAVAANPEARFKAVERYSLNWEGPPTSIQRNDRGPDWIMFPRNDRERIARMDRYVDWKREKIKQRRARLAWLAAGITIGTPLAVSGVAVAWRFCIWVIAG